jgi:hypothetical protein
MRELPPHEIVVNFAKASDTPLLAASSLSIESSLLGLAIEGNKGAFFLELPPVLLFSLL